MQRRGAVYRPHLGATELHNRLLFILGLCALFVPSGTATSAGQRYAGLECVVQVDVRYEERLEFTHVRRSLGEFIFRDGRANRERTGGPPLAWEGPHLLHFFLDTECETRVDRIRAILLGYGSSQNALDLGFKIGPVNEPSSLLQQTLRLHERYRNPKFTRRECIVEIEIVSRSDTRYWNSVGGENPYNFMLSYGKRHHSRLSLFSYSGGSDRIHLIFYDRCNRRVEMASEMMSAYMGRYPTGPKFIVHNKYVDPGPNTINDTGPGWIDTLKPAESRNAR